MLGGRAWEANLFPLTSFELGKQFDLLKYLNVGGLPHVYFSEYPNDELRNYIKLYLKEEIQEAANLRRFDHFVRFLNTAAFSNCEEINYENVANDSGVPARTVASYFELLEDTLIGFHLKPYLRTKSRKAIKKTKFYFFDVGVGAALAKRGRVEEGSELYGKAFEHFIVQEMRAFVSYHNLDFELFYWRQGNQNEVDLIVENKIAIEIKSTERVSEKHLKGLLALKKDSKIEKFCLLSRDPLRREVENVQIIPYHEFLTELWQGEMLPEMSPVDFG